MTLVLKNVSAGYSKNADVIKDVSCRFERGTVTAIIGANGSGKSTLLKVVSRSISLSSGEISLDGQDIRSFPQKELAKRIAILPQVRNVPSVPAKALVMHGRFPYMPFPRIPSSEDKRVVGECMRITDTEQFAEKDVAALSGGQRQRVYVAMLLAQQTDVLLLDEPATFLDLGCQFEMLDLIKKLRGQGKCVIAVLHDIAHALDIADEIILLSDGRKVFSGNSDSLLASSALEKYMNLTPKKLRDGDKDVFYFTKSE